MYPKSLVKGNVLTQTKLKEIDLVLRKISGDINFNEIIVGNTEKIKNCNTDIQNLISKEILK